MALDELPEPVCPPPGYWGDLPVLVSLLLGWVAVPRSFHPLTEWVAFPVQVCPPPGCWGVLPVPVLPLFEQDVPPVLSPFERVAAPVLPPFEQVVLPVLSPFE